MGLFPLLNNLPIICKTPSMIVYAFEFKTKAGQPLRRVCHVAARRLPGAPELCSAPSAGWLPPGCLAHFQFPVWRPQTVLKLKLPPGKVQPVQASGFRAWLIPPPPSGGSLKVTARELFVETLLRVPNSLDVQLPSVLKPWWWFLPEPWGWEWPSSLALNLPQEHWTCKAQAGIHTSFLYSFSTVRSMLCTRLSLKNSSGTCHYPRRGLGDYMRLSQARPLPFKDR